MNAITGNIGAGKSEAAKILESRGFKVIDADKIAHEVLEREMPGLAREALGEVAFADPEFRKNLEELIHPGVKAAILASDADFAEVPLLFEAGWQDLFDKIILITASETVRLERLLARGYTKEHALNRMASQIPQEEKIARANIVIENNGTLTELKEALKQV